MRSKGYMSERRNSELLPLVKILCKPNSTPTVQHERMTHGKTMDLFLI